jgi:hypothetical protein
VTLPDAYTVRARLYPALIGVIPAILLAILAVPWGKAVLPQVGAVVGVGVLFCAFADLARRFGKRIEQSVYDHMGGKPSVAVLRHRDDTMDAVSKAKYCAFLAKSIGEKAPTEALEKADPKAADDFYERCGRWLREHTRDTKKFKVLFEENMTYGFRRNLFGLKWPALVQDILVAVTCILLIVYGLSDATAMYVMLGVAVLHITYFVLVVIRESVIEAARQYARQLILACEVLMPPKPASRGKAATK